MSQTVMRALVTDGLPGNCLLYKFSTNFRDAHRASACTAFRFGSSAVSGCYIAAFAVTWEIVET